MTKKIFHFCIAVIGLFLLLASCVSADIQVKEEVERLIENKEYEAAFEMVNNALADSPNNSEYYYLRGYCYEYTGRHDLAEEDYRTSFSLDNESDRAAFRLGLFHFRRKEYEESVEWLTNAINANSGNFWYHSQRGTVYFEDLKYRSAEKDFLKLINMLSGGNEKLFLITKSYKYLSSIYYMIGKYNEIKRITLIARSIDPDYSHYTEDEFYDERYQVGNIFPTFELKTVKRKIIKSTDLRGKKYILFLWYPSQLMHFSIKENSSELVTYDDFNALGDVYTRYSEDMEIISIFNSVNNNDSRRYNRKDDDRPWNYGQKEANTEFLGKFNFDEGASKLFLVDEDGKILLSSDGVFDSEYVEALLNYSLE
jgi:lipoprotein NlpI